MAHTVSLSPALDSMKITRPLANFLPSIWGDYFLAYASDFKTIDDDYTEEYNELKEEVRRMLTVVAVDNLVEKLNLINEVQRLGVSYHFEIEIEESLEKIYHDDKDFDHSHEDDLNTAALWFRLLRQQGYGVSCDTFNKFKDEEGNFKESLICDIRGLLSLYEATHLSTHADEILDEALVFTTTHLEKSVVSCHTSHPPLERQVKHALNQSIHKNIPRLQARQYLSFYGEEDLRNETLLRFAKLDFNIVQAQHQRELGYLTKWWNKDLDVPSKLPYVRDRIVEVYFWVLAVYFEPKYALDRRLLSKMIGLLVVMDDTYDAYGTLDELELFTQAMQRLDTIPIEQLPGYMQVIYQEILDVYEEMEAETAKQGRSYGVHYAKESMKDVALRGYLQEAKWFNEGYFPTLEEYMPVGLSTSASQMMASHSLVTMGDIATKEAFEWVASDPKIVKATGIIIRLMDDIVSHKFERKRGHVPSSVECYMKQHGVSEEEAIDFLQKQVISAWKDINEDLLKPTAVPAPLLERVFNSARLMDVMYKGADRFTNPHLMKDTIASLFKDPIPI